MLGHNEKALARTFFKLKVHESNGQAFETLFTSIMNYVDPEFQQVKPWGNIGDRKNDGYIQSKGIFYQVFAPEDIRIKYPEAVSKLKTDFAGLLSQWSPVNEFYFVINDKYLGVNADAEITLRQLIKDYKLKRGCIFTAKKLEDYLFSLSDDQILTIVGHIPDPAISMLNFSVLNEIIQHIMQQPLTQIKSSDLKLPDWEQKIKFNQLSNASALRLNDAYLQVKSLEQYLDNNSNFLADSLRDRMNEMYLEEKNKYSGDELFWAIVNKASPKNEAVYQAAVLVIMSKYFEACDIFERPSEETK